MEGRAPPGAGNVARRGCGESDLKAAPCGLSGCGLKGLALSNWTDTADALCRIGEALRRAGTERNRMELPGRPGESARGEPGTGDATMGGGAGHGGVGPLA